MPSETLCFDKSVQIGRRVADPDDDKALGASGALSLGSIGQASAISNTEGTTGADAVNVSGDRWVEVSGDHEIDVYGSEKYDISHNRTVNIGMSPADILEVNVYATTNQTYWAPVTDHYWMPFTETMEMTHTVNESQTPDVFYKTTSLSWTLFSFSVNDISIGIKNVFSAGFHLGFDLALGNMALGNKLIEMKFWQMEGEGKLTVAKFLGAEGKVEGGSAEAGAAKVRAEAEADALPHANPGTVVG